MTEAGMYGGLVARLREVRQAEEMGISVAELRRRRQEHRKAVTDPAMAAYSAALARALAKPSLKDTP